MEKLKKHLNDKSTSLKKVFNQLTNITVVTTGGKARFTKAPASIAILFFYLCFEPL